MNRFAHWNRWPLRLALAVLLAAAGQARADERRPDCYVLSVGIDRFQTAGNLKGCVSDARNISNQFRAQQGKLFGKVVPQTLVDNQATRERIGRELEQISARGTAGDFVVLFFSSHGGRVPGTRSWFLLPHDYNASNQAATSLGDGELLDSAQGMVDQGKKVLIIVDACFAGQLRLTARDYLNRARNPQGGGLILMLSSMPTQTSAALGQYSAFAKAVVDALAGAADLDGDGYVSLREIRHYAYVRTHQLTQQSGQKEQDGECHWSLSISEDLRLAVASRVAAAPQVAPATVASATRPTVWTGSEDLGGYGKLSFNFYPGGRAVMMDAKETSEGTWQRRGKDVTVRFYDGRVVYTGTMEGPAMSGTAANEKTSWSWSVRMSRTAPAVAQQRDD